MFGDGALTFQEFARREPLPLATIQDAVLDFLQGRDDAVVFGAQAVNAYLGEPRMTQGIDIISIRAAALAQELRQFLADRFQIAVRVRTVAQGRGHRLYQVQKEKNRRLVDVRQADQLPAAQRVADVLVMTPVELIASKVIAYQSRLGNPKAGTDWRDIVMLLLEFPELKSESGPVQKSLQASQADERVLAAWKELVSRDFRLDEEDDEF